MAARAGHDQLHGDGQVDRNIRAAIEDQTLPRLVHSSLDPMPEGVRIRIVGAAVSVDDLALWSRVDEEPSARWTHVPNTPLGVQAEARPWSVSPAVESALRRVHESARQAREALGSSETDYILFADADVSYHDIIRVGLAAGRAGLGRMRLAARARDGTLGTVFPYVPTVCDDDGSISHGCGGGVACFRADIAIGPHGVAVRGDRSVQPPEGCVHATRMRPEPAKSAADMRKLFEVEPETPGHDVPARPPEPCVQLTLPQLDLDPQALSRGIDSLAGSLPWCTHPDVYGAQSSWEGVMTVIDLVRAAGSDKVMLASGRFSDRCK